MTELELKCAINRFRLSFSNRLIKIIYRSPVVVKFERLTFPTGWGNHPNKSWGVVRNTWGEEFSISRRELIKPDLVDYDPIQLFYDELFLMDPLLLHVK